MSDLIVPTPPKAPDGNDQINFPIDNVNAATLVYLKKGWLKFIILCGGAAVASVIIGLGYNYFHPGQQVSIWDFIVSISLLPPAGYIAVVRQKMVHEFMKQFAGANGYAYQRSGQLADLNGEMFNLGHSRYTEDIISGQFLNLPLQIFNYRYTVGSGKNQRTYRYTFLRINFGMPLPPVVLKAKHHDFGGDLFAGLGDSSQINTSGDFEKKFQLSSGKEFEMEALQIFEPDFMQAIADKFYNFSLEFVGSNLFIYAYKQITDKTDLQTFYAYAQFLIEKLLPVTKRMAEDVEAMQAAQK